MFPTDVYPLSVGTLQRKRKYKIQAREMEIAKPPLWLWPEVHLATPRYLRATGTALLSLLVTISWVFPRLQS